jgi:hypothetical protein
VLENPAKLGTFVNWNLREVLAEMPRGGYLKNLTIGSCCETAINNECADYLEITTVIGQ